MDKNKSEFWTIKLLPLSAKAPGLPMLYLLLDSINLSDKYTSENIGSFYKLIVGPIDNKTADKLLSTFISKGYKESKLILK